MGLIYIMCLAEVCSTQRHTNRAWNPSPEGSSSGTLVGTVTASRRQIICLAIPNPEDPSVDSSKT